MEEEPLVAALHNTHFEIYASETWRHGECQNEGEMQQEEKHHATMQEQNPFPSFLSLRYHTRARLRPQFAHPFPLSLHIPHWLVSRRKEENGGEGDGPHATFSSVPFGPSLLFFSSRGPSVVSYVYVLFTFRHGAIRHYNAAQPPPRRVRQRRWQVFSSSRRRPFFFFLALTLSGRSCQRAPRWQVWLAAFPLEPRT